MKKKILMFVLACIMILPCAFLFSACGEKKPTQNGISVVVNNVEGNTVTLNYTDYYGEFEPSYLSNYITVYLNNGDDTKTQINYGEGGYTISGLPSVLNANEAGYDITISYGNYNSKIKLVVNKGEIDMSNVSWNYNASYPFTYYNGIEQSVELNNLPNNVTAQYSNNVQTDAGTYQASVQFVYDDLNYKLVNVNFGYTLSWKIEKAEIDMQYTYWDYYSPFTYNGSEYNVSLQNLPSEITSVEYVDNSKTNAGTYTAIANFIYDNNNYQLVYGDFENELEWTINKAGLDLSGISWPSYNFTYNNKTQQIALVGSMPSSVEAIYSGDTEAINVGTYNVSVEFNYDDINYQLNLPADFSYNHEWTIEKASIYLGNVNWSNTDLTYNGEEQIVQLTGINNATEITNVVYKNYYKVNGEYQLIENNPINAGDYKTTVTLVYDNNNYNLTNKNFADEIEWTMAKAENTISGLLDIDDWHYGEEPNEPTGLQALFGNIDYKYYVLVEGEYQKLDGVPTNAGTYYVKGFSQGNENWISVEDSIYYITFKIYSVMVGNPSLEQTYYIYTENAITPTVINLPEGIEVTTTGDTTKTEIGNYTITISLVDKNNYYWAQPDESGDVVLNWEIISSPFTSITLNSEVMTDAEFVNLTTLNIGDELGLVIADGFSCTVVKHYYNINTGVESTDSSALDNNISVNPNSISFEIKINQNAETIYSKTINVNRDIFDKVVVGGQEMTFDEFKANPVVKYGDTLSILLKSEYSSKLSLTFVNDSAITEDTTIKIKENDDISGLEYYLIDITCNTDVITDITLNDQSITLEELKSMTSIDFGSTLSFYVNPSISNYIVIIFENGSSQQITGEKTINVNSMSSIYIEVKESASQLLEYSVNINPEIDVTINGEPYTINSQVYTYERDLNDQSFVIDFGDTFNGYNFKYIINNTGDYIECTESVITVSLSDESNFITIYDHDNNFIFQIEIAKFNPTQNILIETTSSYGQSEVPYSITNNSLYLSINEFITNFEVQFKDAYAECTYSVFNPQGELIEDFTQAESGIYTLKVYLNETEIYTASISLNYNMYIFDNLYFNDNGVAILITNQEQLSKTFDSNIYFTNEVLTFNGSQTLTLIEGQQEVQVNYSATMNGKTYNYSFKLYVEYILEGNNVTNYVSDITITYNDIYDSYYSINFDKDLNISQNPHNFYDLAFIPESGINIQTIGDASVISQEIIFSQAKDICYLEYTISTPEGDKTYRAYIKTYGTISSNTDASLYFEDQSTSEQDITSEIVDNSYTIENIVIEGTLRVITEDSHARIEFYKNSIAEENLISKNSNSLNISTSGTYIIKIISSDNTASRIITVTVTNVDSLIFEVFYNDERLYLENGENGPTGNVTMEVEQNGMTTFYAYFSYVDFGDETTVTLNGNTCYENKLYLPDLTPITSLNNLVLQLLEDTDGSITKIMGAKYAVIYINLFEDVYFPIYFIFAGQPPYPMTFNFDINGDSAIDENDTSFNLKMNFAEVSDGNVENIDLGDFQIGDIGPVINVTRSQLGITNEENTVTAIVKWSRVFNDLSYQFTTDYQIGETPTLTGPTSDNLETELTLNFVDQGDGTLVATIYVCAEGATNDTLAENLLVVKFILV